MNRSCWCFALVGLVFLAARPVRGEDEKLEHYPQVELTTTMGNIIIELDNVRAPKSSENFLRYVKEGFYDGVVFHRVIKEQVIQAGRFDAEYNEKTTGLHDPIPCEWQNGLKNERGTIAVARKTEANSGRAQFFINLRDNNLFDQAWPGYENAGFAVFGRVVQGMDVVDAINNVRTVLETDKFDAERWTVPEEPVIIKKAEVLAVSSARPVEAPPTQRFQVIDIVEQPAPRPAAGQAGSTGGSPGEPASQPQKEKE